MANLVIVAIPSEDDYIHKVSSEKVPHLTILFLGDTTKVKNFSSVVRFVEHAAKTTLSRFGLEVDRRGELGPDQADVLFFSKSRWSGFEEINAFRSNLLQEHNIRTAFDSTEQFPEWIPHITLGYPQSPAKPDERDYPGFNYISFDRIGIWFGDYEGIEIPLKAYEWDEAVAMDNVVEHILAHHGVKGMRWGIRRKATVGAQEVIVSDRRKKVKTSGGKGFPAHSDAVRARTIGQVGKKSGLKALSDDELRAFNNRLNLEQNAKRLQYADSSPPKKFVLSILGQTGKTQASEAANAIASKQVKKALAAAALA